MKILLLTDRMDAGGAETHIAQLAEGLMKLGVEVWLLSSGGRIADRIAQTGVQTIHAPLHSRKPFDLLRSYFILCRLLRREHFDILHAHARLPAFLLRFCKHPHTKQIVSVHARFRVNALLKRLCYWGDLTIAVSEDLRTYVCKAYRVPPERVYVIPNGIDCNIFAPPEPDPRTSAPAILFASRLDCDCSLGAELLCRIAPTLCKRFPGVQIAIAGGGNDSTHISTLADSANSVLGRVAIKTLGWVENMPAVLGQYDIFVGVSRAAMEAAATGCSVILCGNEGYGGIFCKESARHAALTNFCARGEPMPLPDRLETDLTHLLEHPALRKQYATEARNVIETNFSAARVCRETLSQYHRLRSEKKQITVTVGGYFGCKNLGDDAILLGFLEGIHALAPEIGVIALTGAPRINRRRFGIPCVNRKNPLSIRAAFFRSSAFLCGGGSLLQNLTSQRSLSYYLSLLQLARRSRCKPLLYAAGIGPLVGKSATKKTVNVLRKCPYVGLRDEASMRLLSRRGLDAARLHLGADPACLLPLPPPTRAEALLREHQIPDDKDKLCVVLNGTIPSHLLQTLLSAIRIVCKRGALIPIFLVFDRRHDLVAAQKAARSLGGHLLAPTSPTDAIALISACRAVVSLRLHALIFATAVKIPALGIAANRRDPKIASFAHTAGQDFLSPDRLTVPALVEAIEATITDGGRRAPILVDAAAEMRRAARTDLQRILDLLRRPD